MTVSTLLIEMQKLLESELKEFKLKTKDNLPVEPIKDEYSIQFNWNNYKNPIVHIGYRPINVNINDLPSIVIIPPTSVIEDLKGKTVSISILITVRHEDKSKEKNAALAAIGFVERLKDIFFKHKYIASYALNLDKVEWGIDMLINSPDISIAELNLEFNSNNYYGG